MNVLLNRCYFHVHFAVSIGVRHEGLRINHPLFINHLVLLSFSDGLNAEVLGVPYNTMTSSDFVASWNNSASTLVHQWIVDLVQHVVLHHCVVKILAAFGVQAETLDFTLRFLVDLMVAVVFRPRRHKFVNGMRDTGLLVEELVHKIAEVVASDGNVVSGIVVINQHHDTIRIIVEDLFSGLVQFIVQHQACQAGGKGRYEDIGSAVYFHIVLLMRIENIQDVLVVRVGLKFLNVIPVTLKKIMEIVRGGEVGDLGFVGPLPKLPPHAVEHQLCQGSQSIVATFLQFRIVQVNAFSSFEISQELSFLLLCVCILGPPQRLHFKFIHLST